VIDIKKVIEDTQNLIRIDSQNPGIQEEACGIWVKQRLMSMGLKTEEFVVEGNRKNILTTISGSAGAPRLVILGHLDTVPIGSGWSVPPLEGRIIDEKIFGRCACDMKGGVAV